MIKFKKKYRIELAPTLKDHYYGVWEKKKKSEKFIGYFPSSTTCLSAYPQSEQLTQWIAREGWHESQRIKSQAGERGTRVHESVTLLIEKQTLHEENYSREEWSRLDAFVRWYKEYNPEIMGTEIAGYSPKYGYAGRLDIICKISGKIIVNDIKTSSAIHGNFWLQVGSYAQMMEELTDLHIDKTSILQLGASNKNNYRYVESDDWKDDFKHFLSVKHTWEYANDITKDYVPPILTLPDTLSL